MHVKFKTGWKSLYMCVSLCLCLHVILTTSNESCTCTNLYYKEMFCFSCQIVNQLPHRMMNCAKDWGGFFCLFFSNVCMCAMAIDECSQWENEEVSTTNCLRPSGGETKQDLPIGMHTQPAAANDLLRTLIHNHTHIHMYTQTKTFDDIIC